MHGNDVSANPPQASGSGRDPHLEFQLSAKLRARLENLAEWRIDPSLFEFPKDAHEFRGGFATVSQALLASPPDPKESTNESDNTTDERSDSDPDAQSLKSLGDLQQSKVEENVKEECRREHTDNSEGDHVNGEERKERGDKDDGRKSGGQTSKPKVVAVKKLKVENDADLERVLGLALRESEFVVELSHPNIVEFEGFVEDASKNTIWLVFPWEENGNLRDFLASGEWEIPERISLIDDVAKGVEYLHTQTPPIYHGDLKSLNILVNPKFRAVITDFGSARRLGTKDFDQKAKKRDPQPGPEQTTGEESIALQVVYSVSTNTITLTCNKYTLRWAAPELLRDDPPGLACDIWALAWVAYEVMTNTIPFHDVKRDVAVIIRVIQGDLPSITHDARMSFFQALCSLMTQCWSIIPENRPTAEDCARLISFMPMIVPAPTQAGDAGASQTRNAELLLQLGQMYSRQSDHVNASDCFTKALNICATTGDTEGKADALRGLAEAYRFQAEYSKAAGFYSEALQLYTDIGNQRWRAFSLWGLGEMHRHLGEYTEASTSYSQALQVFTDTSDQTGRGSALWGLAEIHRVRGEYTEAIKLYSKALQIQTDVGHSLGRADSLWSLGEVHRSRGEYNEAIEFHSESLKIFTDMGEKAAQSQALWGLAEDYLSQEEYGHATLSYSEALQISTDIGEKPGRADALLGLAKTHDKQGHRSEAISCYMEAYGAYGEIGLSQRAAEALRRAADLHAEEAAWWFNGYIPD